MGRRIACLTALLLWLAVGARAVTFGAPISLEAPQEDQSAPAFDVTVSWDEAGIDYAWDAEGRGWVKSGSDYTTISLANNAAEAVSATLTYQASSSGRSDLLRVTGLSATSQGPGQSTLTVNLAGSGSAEAYLIYESNPPSGDVAGDIAFTITTQVVISLAAGGNGT